MTKFVIVVALLGFLSSMFGCTTANAYKVPNLPKQDIQPISQVDSLNQQFESERNQARSQIQNNNAQLKQLYDEYNRLQTTQFVHQQSYVTNSQTGGTFLITTTTERPEITLKMGQIRDTIYSIENQNRTLQDVLDNNYTAK